MYAPPYGGGFGPTNTSQPFNPNGGPPQSQNPHQQQQQSGMQQMMYNPQAYSAGPPQPLYGAAGPGMGGNGNAGGMGVMQNSGTAHTPGGSSMFPLSIFSSLQGARKSGLTYKTSAASALAYPPSR